MHGITYLQRSMTDLDELLAQKWLCQGQSPTFGPYDALEHLSFIILLSFVAEQREESGDTTQSCNVSHHL